MRNPLRLQYRSRIVVGAGAILIFALTGCAGLLPGAQDAPRDETGEVAEEADIDIFALKVGDCMPANSATGLISEASVIPCAEPHSEEVFHEFALEEGDFPGEDVIDEQVEIECITAFESFVGLDWDSSTLNMYPITPTEDTWNEYDDRVVQCVILDPAQPELTGSLKGAAR